MALTDNLVSYWKLDEASGTRLDSHGTNHLTDNNTVTSLTGKIGNAADFERTNSEWLSCASNTSLQTGTSFAYACWVKLESKTADMVIAGKGGLTNAEWLLQYGVASDKFEFSVFSSAGFGGERSVPSIIAPVTGVWYYVIVGYDINALTTNIQVNNGGLNQDKTGPPQTTTDPFVISYPGNALFFDGLVDEAGYWKGRILATQERTDLYNAGSGRTYPFTIAPPDVIVPTTVEGLTRQLQPLDSFGRPVSLITLYELDLTAKGGQIYYFHDGIQTSDDFPDGVTNGTTTFTSGTAAFTSADIGKIISGPTIVPGSKIASVTDVLTVVLDKAATGSSTLIPFSIWGRSSPNLIVFKANTYNPFPIKAEGFEWSTSGTLPRPKLTVSNIGSVVSALLRQYDDFIGATLTMRQTFSNYVQGGSEPDDTKEFTPQIFVVDRKSAETNSMCSFDLATGMDAEGIVLPRRQVLATACPWIYRGPECGYTGVPKTNRTGATHNGPLVDRGVYNPDVSFTNGSSTIADATYTSATAAFRTDDVGKTITGPFIPANTIIAVRNSATSIELSANATGTRSNLSFTIVSRNVTYAAGNYVYVVVNGVRVYAVSKVANNTGHSIYDEAWWMLDVCLKSEADCETHFGAGVQLPYGGFPAADKLA
jgi:lambda family phage minor tail protein L